MKTGIYFLLIAMMFCMSCSKDGIYGEGEVISEIRALSDFSIINVTGDFEVKLVPSSDFSVEIESHRNILPYIKTEVANNEIFVSYQSGSQVVHANASITIKLPDLAEIQLEGDPKVRTAGSFAGEQLIINGRGNGMVELDSGKYTNLKILSVGNFKINSFDLHTSKCEIATQGNGRYKVNVEDDLKVKINGNGLVYYKGNPTVESEINGNGKVIKS